MSIMSQEAKKQLGCVMHWTGQISSANAPKLITSAGDAKQILPFPGAGIGMFDGNGDYLTIPDSDDWFFGTSDFTIELWYCPTILPTSTNGSLFEIRTTEYESPLVIMHDFYSSNVNKYAVMFSWDWTWGRAMKSTTLASVGRWDHVALVRQGSTFKLYVNGIAESTYNSSNSIGNSGDPLYIGGVPFEATASINGMLCDYRISKNIARYTANFTPPRRQLESDEHTKLLLHFNRNDTTFIDSSPSAHTITAYGDAKQLCSPCGSGVAYFDGTGDYLTIADSSVLELGAGNWTIQGRIYLSTIGRRNGIICKNDTTARYPALMLEINASNRLALTMSSNGSSNDIANAVEGTTTIFVANTWYDIKIIRDGTSIIVYVNGTTEISITSSVTPVDSSYAWGIGCVATDGTGSLLGYISEFEYASTTRPLTIATRPFKPDPYTKLLLHMDGVGNAFYDSSDPPGDNGFPILPDGVTVTPSGTFTTQKMKDGRNYWKFDGSTNYITISDHASWSMFLNNFTIVAWIKFDSIAANRTIIGQYTDANNQWFVRWTTGNVIQLYGITSSTARFDFTCSLTPVAGTWYHVVVQRSGSSCIMYINGVAQTVTQTTAFSATATDIAAVLSIGKINTEYQAGNTKDLQIFTKALIMDQVSALYQETYIY